MIMKLFQEALLEFSNECEKNGMECEFRGGKYPPRIVIREQENLLTENRKRQELTVFGGVETEIKIKNGTKMQKKEMNNLVRGAEGIMKLYLHGFVQEKLGTEEEKSSLD